MSKSRTIVFEQPVSERVRAMLRLEFLFSRAHALEAVTDEWTSRAAVATVLEVMAVMGRGDLRKELLKELDRQAGAIGALEVNPHVDQARLGEVRNSLQNASAKLRAGDALPGMELKDDELLSVIRTRAGIPAGDCNFDLPAYHRWLHKPAQYRQRDLEAWFSAFKPLRDAVGLCLSLLRQSSGPSHEVATAGFFQQTVEGNAPLQIVRVLLPYDAGCYPEVSAGKNRFSVRFMNPPEGNRRASQVSEDVGFDLVCCLF